MMEEEEGVFFFSFLFLVLLDLSWQHAGVAPTPRSSPALAHRMGMAQTCRDAVYPARQYGVPDLGLGTATMPATWSTL